MMSYGANHHLSMCLWPRSTRNALRFDVALSIDDKRWGGMWGRRQNVAPSRRHSWQHRRIQPLHTQTSPVFRQTVDLIPLYVKNDIHIKHLLIRSFPYIYDVFQFQKFYGVKGRLCIIRRCNLNNIFVCGLGATWHAV